MTDILDSHTSLQQHDVIPNNLWYPISLDSPQCFQRVYCVGVQRKMAKFLIAEVLLCCLFESHTSAYKAITSDIEVNFSM